MALRLIFGLLKGLIVGGLLGFALAQLGIAAPAAWIAYPLAALGGALVGLIAGKPIWAADARIEAGLKAVFGGLFAALLMWLMRSFVSIPFPADLGALTAANSSLAETARYGTFGGLAITSLAMICGVLGAFYDADNTPSAGDGASAEKSRIGKAEPKARIGATGEAVDDEFEEPAERTKAKR